MAFNDEFFNSDNDDDESLEELNQPIEESLQTNKGLTKYSLEQLASKAFVDKFNKETLSNAKKYDLISREQVRLLVRLFYMHQNTRVRMNNQIVAYSKTYPKEDHDSLTHIYAQERILEGEIEKIITIYYMKHDFKWFFEQTVGVGPILSALLLSNIDITKADTHGALWRYAGLINEVWEKGQKRPWNAALKTACWKIGQSFIKFSDLPSCDYGKIYLSQKDEYWRRNLDGRHKVRAIEISKTRDMNKLAIGKFYYQGKIDPVLMKQELERVAAEKAAIKAQKATLKAQNIKLNTLPPFPIPTITLENVLAKNGNGLPMLPPSHIDNMSSRYAVKMFLAHLYALWREWEGLPVSEAYAIAILKHTHKVYPKQIPPIKKLSQKSK